jgi:hypothetical protein
VGLARDARYVNERTPEPVDALAVPPTM